MTYDQNKTKFGREPNQYLELWPKICSNKYANPEFGGNFSLLGVQGCNASRQAFGQVAAVGVNIYTLDPADQQADGFYDGMTFTVAWDSFQQPKGVIAEILSYNGTTNQISTTAPVGGIITVGEWYVINDPRVPEACYNTRPTCQDLVNYKETTGQHYYTYPSTRLGKSIAALQSEAQPWMPMIESVSGASIKINPGDRIQFAETIKVTLKDAPFSDIALDPYAPQRNFDPNQQGTYWTKWLARNQFYVGIRAVIADGFVDEPWSQFNWRRREYEVKNIIGPKHANDTVSIELRSPLYVLDSDAAALPSLSGGSLLSGITAGANQLDLSPTGIGDEYPDPPGYVAAGDEIIFYNQKSGDRLSQLTRGTFNTVAQAHNAGTAVQEVVGFDGINVVDAVYNIMVAVGIDPLTIPYDPSGVQDQLEWNLEKDNWLSNNFVHGVIAQPQGVQSIIARLGEQNQFTVWWDAADNEFHLRTNTPPLGNAPVKNITESEHIIRDSLRVTDDYKQHFNQCVVLYNKLNPLGDDSNSNYSHILASVNAQAVSAYGFQRTKYIFANFLDLTDQAVAQQLADRYIARYAFIPKRAVWRMDVKDDDVKVGDLVSITTELTPDQFGNPTSVKYQIVGWKEIKHAEEYEYEALQFNFTSRQAFVAADGTPDYDLASPAEKDSMAFIGPDSGQFPDGGALYTII